MSFRGKEKKVRRALFDRKKTLRWSTCIRESSFNLMPPSTTFPWDCFCEIGIGKWGEGYFPLYPATPFPGTSQVLVARGSGSIGESYCIQRQKRRSLRVTVLPQQGVVGCWGRPRAAPGSLLAAGQGSRSVGWVGVLICFVFVSDFYIQQRSVWWKPVNFVYLAVYCTMGL